MLLESYFIGEYTKTCRIKNGWDGAGKTGQYFGKVAVNGRFWAFVLWDDDSNPALFKSEGLEILDRWVDLDSI